MASCEKCWNDSNRDPMVYAILVESRSRPGKECTPEEQAGVDGRECCFCGRKTIHVFADVCMVPGCCGDNQHDR